MNKESPFSPGARVAIQVDGGYYGPTGYKEQFVDKVFKTGRFTLRESNQQWRPQAPSSYQPHWTAAQTGDQGYSRRPSLRIWDDEANHEIIDAIALRNRFEKFKRLRSQLDVLQFSSLVTDEVIDWMQCVVLAIKPTPEEKP
jgi:hypothetical protein